MKILLNECLPLDFRHSFPGHDAHTAQWAGLKGKKNGELLRAAEVAGYDVLLTVDQESLTNSLLLAGSSRLFWSVPEPIRSKTYCRWWMRSYRRWKRSSPARWLRFHCQIDPSAAWTYPVSESDLATRTVVAFSFRSVFVITVYELTGSFSRPFESANTN
jgi:hypothetical protein